MEKEKRYRRAPNPAHTGSAESSSSNWRSPTLQPAPATSYDRSVTPASRGFQAPTRGHAPTQGSRPRLLDEEYAKRMRNGECLGCGKKGHLQMECPLNAAVKQEVNLLEFSEDEINEAQQYSAIQPIVVPIEIDNHKVLALADSGAAVNLLQDHMVRRASLRSQLAKHPSLLRQAVSSKPVLVNQELLARVKILPQETSKPTIFKVAPISHEAILGMPFLVANNLLIDPVKRELVPKEQVTCACALTPTLAVPSLPKVRVGNAFMYLPDIAVLNIASVCLSSEVEWKEPEEYARLNAAYKKQYADIFSDKLPDRLPPDNGFRHYIEFKDESKKINGRMMWVAPKHRAGLKRFIDNEVKAGRLRPSSSNVASGMFTTPKRTPTAFPRVVSDYQAVNDNTIKDYTPLPRTEDVLEPAVRAKIRAKIDIVSAYSQLFV